MKNPTFIDDALVTGCFASLTSTIALVLRSKTDAGSHFSATNAISHWLYGDKAFSQDQLNLRYTAVGYAIHHMSSTLWAGVYEKWFPVTDGKPTDKIIIDAFKVAALAYFVDYNLTPHRLRPGYEKHLTSVSMAAVYSSFALGLAMRQLRRA
jgi:hypothetical protein